MNANDISRIAALFKDAAQAMLSIVLRGGDERELVRERDSLLSRLLRVVMDVTPRAYAEGGRAALEEPQWEPGPEHREAVQNKADDLAGELAKVVRGIAEDAASLLDDVEGARENGVRYRDRSGRYWQPEEFAKLVLDVHDAVTKNAGAINAGAEIGSRGVLVRDGGNPADDGRACPPCIRADGQRWSLEVFAREPIQHPRCRRAGGLLAPGDDGPLDRE